MSKDKPQGGAGTLEKKRSKTQKPKQYRVLLHNDDFTSMELVVAILMQVFRRDRTEATHIMLTVHHKGVGTAGIFSKEVAETKLMEATEIARANGAPLLLTMEPA